MTNITKYIAENIAKDIVAHRYDKEKETLENKVYVEGRKIYESTFD